VRGHVWKYPFARVSDRMTVAMPRGSTALAFDNQREVPTLWVLAPDTAEWVERTFVLYGTGHETNGRRLEYIGTALFADGDLVLHCFEESP